MHAIITIIDITTFWSDARFILFIEKDAIFQQLLESHVFDILGECILIAGKKADIIYFIYFFISLCL